MLTAEDRIANLTGTIGNPDNVKRIRELIALHEWQFAKTYADFCPHEYTVKFKAKDRQSYSDLVKFIWDHGVDAYFGKKDVPNRYWFDHENGYYYFLFPHDVDENGLPTKQNTVINRGRIADYIFWIDEDLLERKVRCRFDYAKMKARKNQGT